MLITVAVALTLLLCWNTDQTKAQALTAIITVDRTDVPGFTPQDPTQFRAASGRHTFTCSSSGGTGSGPTYLWSSTCDGCRFVGVTATAVSRAAVASYDTGTHTCTVTRGTETAVATTLVHVVGYGIHIFNGAPLDSLPNNALVRLNLVDGFSLRLFCRSDSTVENVGVLIGLDGVAVTSLFDIANPLAGELTVMSSSASIPSDDQGVYTCRIPDSTGTMRDVNVGIYNNEFTPPSVTNPLVFTPGSSSSNLTCTSTGSPATTVIFVRDGTTVGPLRDGESMTFGRVTYQLAQTVSNRRASTYENVLTITEERSSLVGSTFTCTIVNGQGGGNSQLFLIPAVLTVHIVVARTDPPGFTPGSDTEYRAASGPHTFTCTATGGAGSGAYQYEWTSASSTFQESPSNGVIIRQAVHSGDTGTHTCTASRGGESGSDNTVVTVTDGELFQVQVGSVEHCVTWSSKKAKTVESSIQNAIIEVIQLHCKCHFPNSRIFSGQFSCRTTTTRVTYRSTIFGIIGYNASQLVDVLQVWVDSGPTIKVDWLLLDVYASCQVHITSLSVPECSTPETQPFGDPTLITSDPSVIQCVHVCLIRTQGRGICGV